MTFAFLAAQFCFNPAADTWLDPAYPDVQGPPLNAARNVDSVARGVWLTGKSFPGERELIFVVKDAMRGAEESRSEQVETSDRCDQRT